VKDGASLTGKGTIAGSIDGKGAAEMDFEKMERTMEFILDQQARTDVRLDKVGELLHTIGVRLDVLSADAVTFRSDIGRLGVELASVKDIAISHNQAIHQLFRLHEQTQKNAGQTQLNIERLREQQKDDFELNQQNFELLNEQREKDFKSLSEQRQWDFETFQKQSEIFRKDLDLMGEQHRKDFEIFQKKIALQDEQRRKDIEMQQKNLDLLIEQWRKDLRP